MQKFLSLGDGVSLTTVTLLVLGPVLFGLVLIIFEPVFDPSWWSELVFDPAGQAILLFWVSIWLSAWIGPAVALDEEDGPTDGPFPSRLAYTADSFRASASGMLFCLILVGRHETTHSTEENVAAYIAVSFIVFGLALRWRDRRDHVGFSRRAELSDQS
jgi:hypothetical protein